MGNSVKKEETSIKPAPCSLCLSRYQRERQSVSTCNHCPKPFCGDCLRAHENELENANQLSRQFHELEKLVQEKRNMVQQETIKSTEEVNQCFKTHHSDLAEANQTIIHNITNAKYDAERYLNQIHSVLQTINIDTETIHQFNRMEALFIQLHQIQEKLHSYEAINDSKLQLVTPQYTLKFQCIAAPPTDTSGLRESYDSSNIQNNTNKMKSRCKHKSHPYTKTSANGQTKKTSCPNKETNSS